MNPVNIENSTTGYSMSDISIKLTLDEISLIVSVLAQRPYIEVFSVIDKIKSQVQPTSAPTPDTTRIIDPGE